jgi:adenylate kinase
LRVRLLERAKTSGRADDADPVVIQNRIDVYKAETAPVKQFYQNQNKFLKIDGNGSIDHVTKLLFEAIEGA